jgi:hypothetical protein
MGVYFIDLNKACPKDTFSLIKIDRLEDSIVDFELLSFLDIIQDTVKSLFI